MSAGESGLPGMFQIRVELSHLKQSMLHAIRDHHAEMQRLIEEAVAEACAPDRLKRLVAEYVQKHLDEVVSSATRSALQHALYQPIADEVSRAARAAADAALSRTAKGGA